MVRGLSGRVCRGRGWVWICAGGVLDLAASADARANHNTYRWVRCHFAQRYGLAHAPIHRIEPLMAIFGRLYAWHSAGCPPAVDLGFGIAEAPSWCLADVFWPLCGAGAPATAFAH